MPLPFKIIGILFATVIVMNLLSLKQYRHTSAQMIGQRLKLQADSLAVAVNQLKATPGDTRHAAIWQQRFRTVRLAYKKIEWAAEYFDPLTARQVNGPPVPETELSGQIIQPDGLQVIEQDIFPRFIPARKKDLNDLLTRLAANVAEFQAYFGQAELQEWQILDAIKLEVFRIETLGLNDFDDPLSENCFAESAAALQSLGDVIHFYSRDITTDQAVKYLRQPVSFEHFNRIDFIIKYANRLTRQLTALIKRLKLPDIHYNRLLNQDAATLFDADVFNSNAYIMTPEDSATAAKVILGKKLFFDPILSGSGTRSCSSCHQPNKAFTDGLIKNLDITGKKMIRRNTPTLINAALQPAQFDDLRAPSLEDQVNDVMQNRDEMHGNMQVATEKLWRDTVYRKLFKTAYPKLQQIAIDTFEVMNALASYVRSLTALNSRFDAYMRGNTTAMTANEIDGFNLFMGKARCSTCHYLPLFNGALPPRYMQMEAEVIGVPKYKNSKHIDTDPGFFSIQPMEFNRYAFKTTTIRNAARTAPYMHNGVFKTLAEVIDFYDKGGGAGTGISVPNQTLPANRLHLTPKEKQQLIDFIKTLDSH